MLTVNTTLKMKCIHPTMTIRGFLNLSVILLALLLPSCESKPIDHFEVGYDHYVRAQYDSAAWYFREDLARHPNNHNVRFFYADALNLGGDWEAAITNFRLIAYDETFNCEQSAQAARRIAGLYDLKEKPDSAIHYYYYEFHLNAACGGEKDQMGFLYAMISTNYRKAGDLDRALQTIDSALILGAEPGYATIDRGTILYGLQRYGEASAEFDQALSLCGTDSMCRFESHHGRALVALAQGKTGQACSEYREAVRWGHPIPDTALIRTCR